MYVSGDGAHSGQERSLGVYFAAHFGHVRRYASDHGTCAGLPPACLGAIGVTSAPQLWHRWSLSSLTRAPHLAQSRNP